MTNSAPIMPRRDAEQYVGIELSHGNSRGQVVMTMADTGWGTDEAQAYVDQVARLVQPKVVEPVPPPPLVLADSADKPPAPVRPAAVAQKPQEAIATEKPAPEAAPAIPEPAPVAEAPPDPPSDLQVSEELLNRFPRLKPRVEVLLEKARDAWQQWATKPGQCAQTYAELAAEGERHVWRAADRPGPRGRGALLAGCLIAAVVVSLGVGIALTFLQRPLAPHTWPLLGAAGAVAGFLLWAALCWTTGEPHSRGADPKAALEFAAKLGAFCRVVDGGFAGDVRATCADLRRQARDLGRQVRSAERSARRKAASAPFMMQDVTDACVELGHVAQRASKVKRQITGTALGTEITEVEQLPAHSPARHRKAWLTDGLGQKTDYRVTAFGVARDHMAQQADRLKADCDRLNAELTRFARSRPAPDDSTAPAESASVAPEDTDYADLQAALRRALSVLDRDGRKWVEAAEVHVNSAKRLRVQFNEMAQRCGWAVRA